MICLPLDVSGVECLIECFPSLRLNFRLYDWLFFASYFLSTYINWYFFEVFVANVGDAKAVIARSVVHGSQNHTDGLSSLKAIVVTREHKAIYPQERARIQKVMVSYSKVLWCTDTHTRKYITLSYDHAFKLIYKITFLLTSSGLLDHWSSSYG